MKKSHIDGIASPSQAAESLAGAKAREAGTKALAAAQTEEELYKLLYPEPTPTAAAEPAAAEDAIIFVTLEEAKLSSAAVNTPTHKSSHDLRS